MEGKVVKEVEEVEEVEEATGKEKEGVDWEGMVMVEWGWEGMVREKEEED